MHRTPISEPLKHALSRLPYMTAHLPGIGGLIKAEPAHFQVQEILPYAPCGEGEHVYVTLKRQGWNTTDVARTLRQAFALKATDIGWGGRKDKNAVTTQTFSLQLPMRVDISEVQHKLDALPFDLLDIQRHRNKIKTGHVAANWFKIVVSQVGPGALRKAQSIADALSRCGIANYYGEQRFGWQMRNLDHAEKLVRKGRAGRGKNDRFIVSVLQSALFNFWLKQRIESGRFDTIVRGDVARKTDTGGMFIVEDVTEALQRLTDRRIIYTGPIYGYKMMSAIDKAGEKEKQILAAFDLGIQQFKPLKAPGSRRPAQLFLKDLRITPAPEGLLFSFTLPSGAYATTVLREFMRPD